jgi:hypothetical protein
MSLSPETISSKIPEVSSDWNFLGTLLLLLDGKLKKKTITKQLESEIITNNEPNKRVR